MCTVTHPWRPVGRNKLYGEHFDGLHQTHKIQWLPRAGHMRECRVMAKGCGASLQGDEMF